MVKPNVYEFFKLKKHFSNFGKQTNVLFYESFSLAETQMQIKRTVYDVWAMMAYLGGILYAFITLGLIFIKPFAKISFEFDAITSLYIIKSSSKTIQGKINFFQKLR